MLEGWSVRDVLEYVITRRYRQFFYQYSESVCVTVVLGTVQGQMFLSHGYTLTLYVSVFSTLYFLNSHSKENQTVLENLNEL